MQQSAAPSGMEKIHSTAVASVARTTLRVSPDGIVHMPANVQIKNSTYNLDLNNDGITDFVIQETNEYSGPTCNGQFSRYGVLTLSSGDSNGFQVHLGYVAKLVGRSPIGPNEFFTTGLFSMESVSLMISQGGRGCNVSFVARGNWKPFADPTRGYLGLAFVIGGKTHYGWAAIKVHGGETGWPSATLTGYGYQTQAGKSIKAGQI